MKRVNKFPNEPDELTEDEMKVAQVVDALDGKQEWYDPPSGWMYGFPKPYRPLQGESIDETLRRDGYPERELKQGLANYTRFWSQSKKIGV